MLSFSNFGSTPHEQATKVRQATELVKQLRPDLQIDGEMQADVAVVPELMQRHYPFSQVQRRQRAGLPATGRGQHGL